MTTLFNLPDTGDETLTSEALAKITGGARRDAQLEWLKKNRWQHTNNRHGDPIVVRLYANLKLPGIEPNFSWAYVRQDTLGTRTYVHTLAAEALGIEVDQTDEESIR